MQIISEEDDLKESVLLSMKYFTEQKIYAYLPFAFY
jgi:hypothetical protein